MWVYHRKACRCWCCRNTTSGGGCRIHDGAVGWIQSTMLSAARTVVVTGDKPAPMRDATRWMRIFSPTGAGVVAQAGSLQAQSCEIIAAGADRLDQTRNTSGEWTRVKPSDEPGAETRGFDPAAGRSFRQPRNRLRRRKPEGLADWMHAPRGVSATGDGIASPARADFLGDVRMGAQSLHAAHHDLSVRAVFREPCGGRWRARAGDFGRHSSL